MTITEHVQAIRERAKQMRAGVLGGRGYVAVDSSFPDFLDSMADALEESVFTIKELQTLHYALATAPSAMHNEALLERLSAAIDRRYRAGDR